MGYLVHNVGRPGKTAARLLQDLLTYDPPHQERAGRNLLTDPPPLYTPGTEPVRAVPARNCRHNFLAKHDQCHLPTASKLAAGDVACVVTCICSACRWHMDLEVAAADHYRSLPCPSRDYPLHHFLFLGGQRGDADGACSWEFKCSAPDCPVQLRISMRPPRLRDESVLRLTDSVRLGQRFELAKRDPDVVRRRIERPARSADVLGYLQRYLEDALNPSDDKQRIPVKNPVFSRSFGEDCDDVLMELGFSKRMEVDDDEYQVFVWMLPQPSLPAEEGGTPRTLLEDARYELSILILSIPESERTKRDTSGLYAALPHLEASLACLNYNKKPMTRAAARSANHEEDHPYYAGLGAVGDFSDEFVFFAYERQVEVDSMRAPYYFESLQDIAIGRDSFTLQEKVQLLASNGQTSRREVSAAYSYLGIDPSHHSSLTDNVIIGKFKARLGDIGSTQVQESRDMLRVLGYARKSDAILAEASNAIESYDQALSWLGLDESQPDDFVVGMCSLKASENPALQASARKAVELIAHHRQSARLWEYLETGNMSAAEMDVSEAYALLGVTDRTAAIELDVLQNQVTAFITPENAERYQQAYKLIEKDQSENHNRSLAYQPRNIYPLASWPVGCQNIGNTCYLNSILQFLFTIKPLRDLVLNFDAHAQECTDDALRTKRVGRSIVSVHKAQAALEFVLELRKLFELMITAPHESIRPPHRLAYLALAHHVAEPLSAVPEQHGLGEIEGKPVVGPMPNSDAPAAPEPQSQSSPVLGNSHDQEDVKSESSSTVVLVDSDEEGSSQERGRPTIKLNPPPRPPSRPPPVPPRPKSNVRDADIRAAEANAQQDAAEILNHAFDLFSCAMKAEGEMDDGEQFDLIKKLFYSNITTVWQTGGSTTNNQALQDNILTSPGDRDRHLYAALDDEFDLVDVDNASGDAEKHTTKFEYFDHAPPVLIINVRRLDYDPATKRTKKITHHVDMDDTLFLDRYLKETKSMSADELSARRQKKWALQKELQEAESRQAELTGAERTLGSAGIVGQTAKFVNGIRDIDEEQTEHEDSSLVDELQHKAAALQEEVETIDETMRNLNHEINAVFADMHDHPYQVHAVFMHRGNESGGHYWIFIRDFQHNVWRKYNDDMVDQVNDVSEIFLQEKENPATSTAMVYVRAGDACELTEAVHRKPDLPPSEDVEMKEATAEPVAAGANGTLKAGGYNAQAREHP